MRQRLAVSVISIILIACTDTSETTLDPTVRDSAGIRIVTYPGSPASPATFELSAQPSYVFGDDPDEYLFDFVSAGVLRGDGSAVIADYRRSEIVVVKSDGTIEMVLAREGPGPGEVRGINSLHILTGDSLLVEDDGNARFSVFHGGGFAESSAAGSPLEALYAVVQGVGEEGNLLMSTSAFTPAFSAEWRDGYVMTFDRLHGVTDTVAAFPFLSPNQEGHLNLFSPGGVTTVSAGSFVVGRTDLPEIKWMTSNGDLKQIVRWTADAQHASRSDLMLYEERYRRSMAYSNPGMSPQAVESLVRRSLQDSEANIGQPVPLFGVLVPDGAGGVLVGEYVIGGGNPTQFSFIAADGNWSGSLEVPENLRILDVRDGRVLAVIADDLDVESVAVYELHRSPPQAAN